MKKKDTRPDPFPVLLHFRLPFIQELEKIDKGKMENRTRKNWMENVIIEKFEEIKNKK